MDTEQEFRKMQKKAKAADVTGTGMQLLGIVLMVQGFLGILMDATDDTVTMKTALFLLAAFLLMVGGYALGKVVRKGYEKNFREYVVNRAAAGLFEEYEFMQDWGFPGKELKEKGLIRLSYLYNSKDLLRGQYHDVGFSRADFSSNQKLFPGVRVKGNWTVFTFQKPFEADLQVSCGFMKNESRIKRGSLVSKNEPRHIITTGDSEFDNEFTCSGQDSEEALTLLTPSVRMKLLSLRYMKRMSFVIGWVDRELHFIVFNGKETATPPARGKLDLGKEIHDTKEELGIICEIIDDMMMSRSIYADYVISEMENLKQTEAVEGTVKQ